MKKSAFLCLMFFASLFYGQEKQEKVNYLRFDKVTEVKGTEYVIVSIESYSKTPGKSEYLLFINTKTGKSKQSDFPSEAQINKFEQVKIDSLGINQIIITAKTYDLNDNKSIDGKDPLQVFVFSPDGKRQAQLTDNKFFSRTWVTNDVTGAIVITGYVDTNGNNEYDKSDKEEILVYDLKTFKLLSKF